MPLLDVIRDLRRKGGKAYCILIDPDKPETLSLLDHLPEHPPLVILVGGSLLSGQPAETLIREIRARTNLPVVLFPGNSFQLSGSADAILFLSLISGRNPEYLIGHHVVAAPFLRNSGMEVLPTGYMLVDSGRLTTAHYMSASLPIPADKPEIAAATAMAGEMLGLQLIYLDAGSGAQQRVPDAVISAVRKSVDLPLLAGGGIRNVQEAEAAWQAGADIVVVGTAMEQDPRSGVMHELSESIKKRQTHAGR